MSWASVELDTAADVVRGVTFKKGDASESPGPGLVPVLRAGNIGDQLNTDDDLVFVDEKFVSENQRLRANDILVCMSSGSTKVLGKSAILEHEWPGSFGAFLATLRPRTDVLHPQFLAHYLRTPQFRTWASASSGVGIKNIRASDLKSYEIPLPPLEEQKRIAGVLDQADALRRLRARALDRLNTLGQAIFHDMFGDGKAPKIEIRDLGRVQTGSTPSTKIPEYFEGDIPFVTPGDLEADGPAARFVSEEGAENSRTVQQGATLVCCIGTIGKMGMADQRSAFNQQINSIEWSDEVLPEYGLYAMRGIKNEIIHIGKGAATTLPIVKKSLFEKMKIRVAPLDEQKTFVDRVQEIEVYKRVFTDALGIQSSLFVSLQHRAFRGDL